jgi:hypothetical protein
MASCSDVLITLITRTSDAEVPQLKPVRVRRPRGPSGRYALALLDRKADRVSTAQPGTRNSTLNRAAFRLGQLVATGALDRTMVEVALAGAALAAGLGQHEVETAA